jgi:hypothetical protein
VRQGFLHFLPELSLFVGFQVSREKVSLGQQELAVAVNFRRNGPYYHVLILGSEKKELGPSNVRKSSKGVRNFGAYGTNVAPPNQKKMECPNHFSRHFGAILTKIDNGSYRLAGSSPTEVCRRPNR